MLFGKQISTINQLVNEVLKIDRMVFVTQAKWC